MWIEAKYRDFYDVPHIIVIEGIDGKRVLLDAPFDEELDEYRDRYEVVVCGTTGELPPSWEHLAEAGGTPIGFVAVKDIQWRCVRMGVVELDPLSPGMQGVLAMLARRVERSGV